MCLYMYIVFTVSHYLPLGTIGRLKIMRVALPAHLHTTKPIKWHVRPAKTQISLRIRPVWSESSLSAWRNHGSLATHWAHSEDSDQTGRMPRLIWVFVERTVILLALIISGAWQSTLICRSQIWSWNQRLYGSEQSLLKSYGKVQGVPQSQVATNPWHQEEEKKDKN